ncbi:MAG: hypothetical protein K2K13_04405 [Clostridiales bacterium]|nr:hypothetical protein [Clostridiales bacterium]
MNNRLKKSIAKMLCLTTCVTAIATPLMACGNKDDIPALVLATDALDTVFNPFFYTSGADGEIVGQTQIGMLSSDKDGKLIANWDEPCVALAWGYEKHGSKDDVQGNNYNGYQTDYYYAIKDNIMFSDGKPLTKDDVLFNIYMYLDPAYTGSNTMYSVKIQGLTEYRTQTEDLDNASGAEEFFQSAVDGRMTAIEEWCDDQNYAWTQEYFDRCDYTGDDDNTLESDMNKVLSYYRDSLNDTWTSAISADIVKDENNGQNYAKDYAKYKDKDNNYIFTEPWQLFLYYNNLFTLTPHRNQSGEIDYYEYDHSFPAKDIPASANDRTGEAFKNALIEYAYNTKFYVNPNGGTARTRAFKDNMVAILYGNYSVYVNMSDYLLSDAKHRYFGENMPVKNVKGIRIERMSEIPYTDKDSGNKTMITLKDKDGNPKEYDVLHITINGVDPKAEQNFAFTVAPGHHYSTPEEWAKATGDNGADNEFFGVKFSDPEFMDSVRVKQLPLGAGPFRAAKSDGGVATSKGQFFGSNNIVNFEANPYFLLGEPKIKKLRYKVISNSQLYNAVNTGDVDYASPSMNSQDINGLLNNDKLSSKNTQNLGYGYIGVSAQYIPNIYIRKGIMTTFNAQSTVDYYGDTGASLIRRPMSKTLTDYYRDDWDDWYPFDESGATAAEWFLKGGCERRNGVWYDENGNVMKYTFTIAGDSDDHPANNLLLRSANILNKMGCDITVTHDSTALSKLSSGLLTVWAAAWSSSSDPDMYQVYHKDSQATSTTAWGYRYLLSNKYTGLKVNPNNFDQVQMIKDLSDKIDAGRETDVKSERKKIYSITEDDDKCALDMLMDLAVEFPTYQRQVYYVWRKGIFNESTLSSEVTSYQSPLSRIWEVELVKKA